MRDGETASPFVRFGLVRYQPHTHRALHCSRPVAQWVKPLPKRYVSIRPAIDRRSVLVEMFGRTSTGRCWPAVVKESDAKDAGQPSMRVSLFEDYVDSGGRHARRFHRLPTNGDGADTDTAVIKGMDLAFAKTRDDGSILVKPTIGSGSTGDYASWRVTLPLHERAGRYKLHVEEVEHFLPASFEQEPVDEKFMREAGRFVEGGPRLATTFELPEQRDVPSK